MTDKLITTAPGKVVLCGEYAVLDGAPAVAMAVTRRARVVIESIDGDVYRVTSPGFSDTAAEFSVDAQGLNWLQGSPESLLVDAVWHSASPAANGAQAITLDSRAFLDDATAEKIGIGSSAALVVALCAALRASTDISSIAHRAHVAWQGGVGSGIDVACSLYGGLLEYRREGLSAVPLRWPAGLCFKLLWSGRPVSTRDKLKLLDATTRQPSRVRLVAAAEVLADSWRAAHAGDIVEQYRDYIEQLRAFSADHGLGVFEAGHDELVEKAAGAEIVYKPCGAGGGDVGVVLGTDRATMHEFIAANAADYSILDVDLDEEGVRLE